MSEKQYNAILSVVCGMLLFFCFLAFMGKKSLSGETIDTALSNSKYSSNLAHIEISHNGKSIFLQRNETGSLWLGSEGLTQSLDGQGGSQSLVFPVDSTTIREFIFAMEQVRPLSLISQKQDKDTLASFGLDGESGYTVSLSLNDGSTVSQVTFGDKNYSGHRVYLKTPDSPIYQTQDQFYPWLSTSGKSWADMSLVSLPLLGIASENQVQGLTMKFFDESEPEKKIFSPAEEDFSFKTSRLLGLRGGSLILPSRAEGQPLVGEITVDTGFGSRCILRIYQGAYSQADQGVSSYYLIPEYKTSALNYGFEISGLNYGFEISGLNYGFEISPWTWNNLRELAR